MSGAANTRTEKQADSRDIGDFSKAAEVRRQQAWALSMSERLAQVHELCKQMNAVKGAATPR